MQPGSHDAAMPSLRALLGERLSRGSSILELHSRDEAYTIPQLPDDVAFPETAEEVSQILRICSEYRCPVVPFGIGTSLEGHVVPIQGGISLDMTRMNKIIEINANDLNAVVQPGVTRNQLNGDLRGTGLMFTVDPGPDTTIGGMAATRASRTNTIRYGTMADNVKALQVVLADGRIIRTGTRARKSSAGYNLTQLFVGSEGTLGVITEVTVKLYTQPEAIVAATCAFDTLDDAVQTVIVAIQSGLSMARAELLDEVQMRGFNIHNPGFGLLERPYLFLEFHGLPAFVEQEVEMFSEIAREHGGRNFNRATKTEDRARLWAARHEAYYAAKALRVGATGVVTDCCVPVSALGECLLRAQHAISKSGLIAPIICHVGDGNFHLFILVEPGNPAEFKRAIALAETVCMLALELGGTVTGEHGVGVGKRKFMAAEHGEAYDLMKQLKTTFDPMNILNPGKLGN